MSVDALLSGLAGVRRTGPNKWAAKCPAHQGRRASLAVRELDDGRVLVHCFAGCEVESVLSAAGVAFEALFPPRSSSHPSAQGERRPFSVSDLIAALSAELNVAWLILADIAGGREIGPAERKRAGVARERCRALIDELRHVR